MTNEEDDHKGTLALSSEEESLSARLFVSWLVPRLWPTIEASSSLCFVDTTHTCVDTWLTFALNSLFDKNEDLDSGDPHLDSFAALFGGAVAYLGDRYLEEDGSGVPFPWNATTRAALFLEWDSLTYGFHEFADAHSQPPDYCRGCGETIEACSCPVCLGCAHLNPDCSRHAFCIPDCTERAAFRRGDLTY